MTYTCKPSKIAIYVNTQKKTMAQVKAETGCTALINGEEIDAKLDSVSTLESRIATLEGA